MLERCVSFTEKKTQWQTMTLWRSTRHRFVSTPRCSVYTTHHGSRVIKFHVYNMITHQAFVECSRIWFTLKDFPSPSGWNSYINWDVSDDWCKIVRLLFTYLSAATTSSINLNAVSQSSLKLLDVHKKGLHWTHLSGWTLPCSTVWVVCARKHAHLWALWACGMVAPSMPLQKKAFSLFCLSLLNLPPSLLWSSSWQSCLPVPLNSPGSYNAQ